MDHSSDPVNCIKHLRDVTEKIDELTGKGSELDGHAKIINNWYKELLAKKKLGEKPSNIEQTIDEMQATLHKFNSDLKVRLNLWAHMNEWQ